MNTERSDNLEALLEAHLSGRLESAAREAFAAQLAADPALQAAARLQDGIDRALHRIVQPSDAESVLTRLASAQSAGRVEALRRQQRRLRMVRYAVAAALVFCVGGGGWWYWNASRAPTGGYEVRPWRNFETVYRDEVKAGFTADWECKSDKEFATVFWERFGQGLLLTTPPANVTSLGLSYCNSLSPRTVHFLVRVDGQPVIVFIDRTRQDKPLSVAPESGLHLYRRELGNEVLYELSPLDQPHVLELFYDPGKPADWYRP